MERGTISISKSGVSITGANIWMTDYEITDLLGVTLSAVRNHVKSIFKSGVLSESGTYRYILLENGNRADAYNMEMITALVFRLNSLPANIFRQWIVRKVVTPIHSHPPIVLQLKDGYLC